MIRALRFMLVFRVNVKLEDRLITSEFGIEFRNRFLKVNYENLVQGSLTHKSSRGPSFKCDKSLNQQFNN